MELHLRHGAMLGGAEELWDRWIDGLVHLAKEEGIRLQVPAIAEAFRGLVLLSAVLFLRSFCTSQAAPVVRYQSTCMLTSLSFFPSHSLLLQLRTPSSAFIFSPAKVTVRHKLPRQQFSQSSAMSRNMGQATGTATTMSQVVLQIEYGICNQTSRSFRS